MTSGPPEVERRGPVFVVGSMRSGSTMLRLILDSHPDIAIGGETGFMGGLLAVKRIPNWQFGAGWYERLGWTEPEIDDRLREFYSGLFERHAAQQGKRRWGEKTPFHTQHMCAMAQVFPDASFVGIVRHPGAVAASLRKRFHYTYGDAVDYWLQTNLEMVRSGTSLGPRFTLCRYEDLVLEREPVLRELLDRLDEPWSPLVLEHHRVQREKGAPRAVEGSTVTSHPIDGRRALQWTREAAVEDVHELERAAPLAEFFGYNPSEPVPRRQLAALDETSPHWVATGDVLAALGRDWHGRLDTLRPRVLPMVDASPQELAGRLAQAEQALARVRSRRAVRYVDALRKIQHGRSLQDVRAAWTIARGRRDPRNR